MHVNDKCPSTKRACASFHKADALDCLSLSHSLSNMATEHRLKLVIRSIVLMTFSIKEIEDATAVQLYRRDCKTLAASIARYPGRAGKAKTELKYYLLNYCCDTRHGVLATGQTQSMYDMI